MSILTNIAVKLAVFYVTAPNMEVAQKLSQVLIKNKLIACCNIIENVQSFYIWQNQIQNEKEVLLVMKSREILAPQIVETVKCHHPYLLPEVIGMPIVAGSSKYMDWVIENTKDPTQNELNNNQEKQSIKQQQPCERT